MFRNGVISVILVAASVCYAFAGDDFWTVSKGADCVTEFQSERLPYPHYCSSYTIVGRPDEIFVSSSRKDTLMGIRRGEFKASPSGKVYVLNLKTKTASTMRLDRFLGLDILFEDLPVGGYEDHPELKYGGEPDAHSYVAPIRRNGKGFVATLSSRGEAIQKTTFGLPSIIPFWGRKKWFEKEIFYSGTLFLEVFDEGRPSEPIVQLQKMYRDRTYLPPIFKMASWAQGSERPFLVVVCEGNRTKGIPARVFVIRPQ
jgi:hypothetical protein